MIDCRKKKTERGLHPDVFMYLDPPYLLGARRGKQYRHEMTDADHGELLDAVLNSRAKIMISGYESDMYNERLSGWRRECFMSCAEGGKPRREIVWMNCRQDMQMSLEDFPEAPPQRSADAEEAGRGACFEKGEMRVMENRKRLTWTDESGKWGLRDYDIRQAPGELMGALCKLKDYEMSGIDPGQLRTAGREYSMMAKELAHYRSLLKKGLLIELPCGAGSTIYRVDMTLEDPGADPEQCAADRIEIYEDGRVLYAAWDGSPVCDLESLRSGTPYLDRFMIFRTFDDAQRMLCRLRMRQQA